MGQFAIHKKFANVGDIVRTYMFDLTIPGTVAGANSDDLLVRVRNVSIPGRGNTPIESSFFGMKTFFPGRVELAGTVAVTFEEFEDRTVSTALYNWQQQIFDWEDGGASQKASKADIAETLILQIYGYNGEPLAENGKIHFFNAWPQNIADVALSYEDNASVKYEVTFQYDRWELK